MKNKLNKKEYYKTLDTMKDVLIDAQNVLIKEYKSGYGITACTQSVEDAKNQIKEFKENNEII